jgi:hypothetical protein
MVNDWGAAELLNARTVGADKPPPEGVTVMEPVKMAFGVAVKLEEAVPSEPPVGPESV